MLLHAGERRFENTADSSTGFPAAATQLELDETSARLPPTIRGPSASTSRSLFFCFHGLLPLSCCSITDDVRALLAGPSSLVLQARSHGALFPRPPSPGYFCTGRRSNTLPQMSGHLQRLYAETGHDDEGLQKCLKCALTALHLHDEFGYTMDTSTNGVRHEAWLEYAGGPASALLALFRREIHPPSRLSELEKLQGACAAYRPHNSSSSAQALLFVSASLPLFASQKRRGIC